MARFMRSARAKGPRVSRRPSFRPCLERLEDRTLLSAGALDPTFGNGGIVAENTFRSVLGVQSDGKLLIADEVYNQGLSLTRYNADGSLDQTFLGSNGHSYLLAGMGNFSPTTVVVQSDGKILVAGTDDLPTLDPNFGYQFEGSDAHEFFVARFNSDGTQDMSFGAAGYVLTQVGQQDYAAGVVIQSDGKIVAAGTADEQFALVRYDSHGTADATFGNAGTVVTPAVGLQDHTGAIALQSDGKIIVTGNFVGSVSSADFGTIRYNTDGTLDVSFGNGGIVETPIAGNNSGGEAVAVQANGDIVVAGSVDANGHDFYPTLLRYTPDGKLDATFADDGRLTTNYSWIPINGAKIRLALQADGRILLGTSIFSSDAGVNEIVLARFNGDGSADASFGDNGQVVTNPGNDSINLTDMAQQPDGKIVITGFGVGVGELVRFQNDSLPLVIPLGPPPAPSQPSGNSEQNQPAQNSVVSSSPPPAASAPSANSLLLDAVSPTPSTPATSTVSSPLNFVASSSSVVPTASAPSNADPFGIHLVGGAGSVVSDAADDANVLIGPSPVAPVETTATQAALPSVPRVPSFAVPTVVLDAIFQLMPLWTRTAFLAPPLPAIEGPLPPSSKQAAPAAPVVNGSLLVTFLPHWPALCRRRRSAFPGYLSSAEAEWSRRQSRRFDAAK